MCAPTTATATANIDPATRRVVIAGAGPAGLLLQALLHRRNKAPGARVLYDVTLVESRVDLGRLDGDELEAHRSWMIGLAGHGLEAVRTVPGLYEDYLAGVGVEINEGHIFFGNRRLSMGLTDDNENFIVDRNFVVAALARYAKDHMASSPCYTLKYETEMLYVDYENKRVLVRDKNTKEEEYLPYDLLVGADGIRSTVREALVKRHFDFELQVGDIFQAFKAVHIRCPEAVSPTSLSILPACFPKFNGICLPETGGMVNLSMGVSRNEFENIPDELKSDDPEVVAKFFKEKWKAFELTDEGYHDWATQWVGQRWNRTGMVHCNRYASVECGVVLMGDSAHATSPSIGMGMNTALRDAQKFNELLDEFGDDLDKVLPRYSKDRVPEGNSLTDVALNGYCFDAGVGLRTQLKAVLRSGLHRLFPSFVDKDYNTIIGMPGHTLSDVYQMATEQGVLRKHRAINQRIRHEFFERETGMIKERPRCSAWGKVVLVAAPVAACAMAMFVNK